MIAQLVHRAYEKIRLKAENERLLRDLKDANAMLAEELKHRMTSIQEYRKVVDQLTEAFGRVKQLEGILPICAWCKKIRDDKGHWTKIESYVEAHSHAEFSHGMSPECAQKFE